MITYEPFYETMKVKGISTYKLVKDFNISRSLKSYGLQTGDLEWVVKNSRSGSMRANPRDFSDEELTSILLETF